MIAPSSAERASPSRSFAARFGSAPHSAIALLGRVSIAAVFWQSGQTKVQGLQIDLVRGRYEFGWPRWADSTLELFREEYRLPVVAPETAAVLATAAEHLFPILIVVGLATRLSALVLLAMTAVIQVFVYPAAYPTHGVWATVLLLLVWGGAGRLSLDHLIARRA
jgi:putative oxidoreductase